MILPIWTPLSGAPLDIWAAFLLGFALGWNIELFLGDK
jgi:hypothetical protein